MLLASLGVRPSGSIAGRVRRSTTGTVAGTNPVFEATTIFQAPRTTAPANVGGFSTASSATVA